MSKIYKEKLGEEVYFNLSKKERDSIEEREIFLLSNTLVTMCNSFFTLSSFIALLLWNNNFLIFTTCVLLMSNAFWLWVNLRNLKTYKKMLDKLKNKYEVVK